MTPYIKTLPKKKGPSKEEQPQDKQYLDDLLKHLYRVDRQMGLREISPIQALGITAVLQSKK
jgi:hypothetical protein